MDIDHMILGGALVLAGAYITYLQYLMREHTFHRNLFGAFWDAVVEHVDSLDSILDVAKDIHVDCAIAESEDNYIAHIVSKTDMLCLSIEERIEHINAIMNMDDSVELELDID